MAFQGNVKLKDDIKLKSNVKLKSWLMTKGSLTARLEKQAGQALCVKRVYEGFRCLTLAEKKQLGYGGYQLNRQILAWVREVYLYGNSDKAWVKASSIFPLVSLKGQAQRLRYLRCTPIGYVLFKRQNFLPHQRTIIDTSEGWQRQTVYDWYGRKILICECFLPEFEKVCNNHNSVHDKNLPTLITA